MGCVKSIFEKLAAHQTSGLMFHDQMADYYGFLCLEDFQEFHECQLKDEMKLMRKIKNYYLDCYHGLLYFEPKKVSVIPVEWESKTSLDVEGSSIKVLLKNSLKTYLEWEETTKECYCECAEELFEMGKYKDYKFVEKLIDDVETEITHLKKIIIYLQSVNYDCVAIKDFKHRL